MTNYLDWLKADIENRIKKMEILLSMNNGLHDEMIESLEGEIYEREQEMDALTGDMA